jgi:hypothetical protein
MTQGTKRGRTVFAAVLTGLVALLLTVSAALKLFAVAPLPGQMETWGLGGWRVVIGLGELVSAALFVNPRTAELGTLLLSAYLGGAIVTHMQHGEPFIIPAVVLLAVWTAAVLRLPGLTTRLRGVA